MSREPFFLLLFFPLSFSLLDKDYAGALIEDKRENLEIIGLEQKVESYAKNA